MKNLIVLKNGKARLIVPIEKLQDEVKPPVAITLSVSWCKGYPKDGNGLFWADIAQKGKKLEVISLEEITDEKVFRKHLKIEKINSVTKVTLMVGTSINFTLSKTGWKMDFLQTKDQSIFVAKSSYDKTESSLQYALWGWNKPHSISSKLGGLPNVVKLYLTNLLNEICEKEKYYVEAKVSIDLSAFTNISV